jgi:UPF0716 family protein affecting phage T7 exclusion
MSAGDRLPMGMVKTIACGLVLLPVAEIVAFFVVVGLIGLARTVILLALISLAGLLVLRRAGGRTARTDQVVFAGLDPAAVAAGILLLLPGFITGLLGALMLHAQSRHWLLRMLARRGAARRRAPGPQVIELSPNEWKRLPEPKPPPRRWRPTPWRRGAAAGSDPRNP